jgi:DNA-binding transcriptional LysR family regulator
MDLRRYAHLVALADEANFGRAATRVHLSQPAFSRSIQAAETDLGMVLFERSGAGIRCTRAGAFVVERARRLLLESSRLERDLALYRNLEKGELAFGIGTFAAPAFLPTLLPALRSRHPGIRLVVKVNNTRILALQVKQEQTEFFIGDTRYVQDDPAFTVQPAGSLPGAFYVRAGHPLLAKPGVRLADLVPYGLATSWLPDEVRVTLATRMGLAPGDELPLALDCDDVQALRIAMLDGNAVMIGSVSQVQHDLATGTAVELPVADRPGSASRVGIVRLRGRIDSPIAAEATQLLAETAALFPAAAAAAS